MKKFAYALILAVLALSLQANAQALYKWVDAQGKISYSDQPPPPSQNVKDLSNTVNAMGAGQAQAETLPFEMQQLAQRAPVVIYTSKGCAPCDQGRVLLRSKNVPFSEKTVNSNADLIALNAQFKTQTLPILAIGKASINGFGTSQWSAALSEAGYTDLAALPKSYNNGQALSLASPEAASPVNKEFAASPAANAAATAAAPAPVTRTRRVATPATPDPVIKF